MDKLEKVVSEYIKLCEEIGFDEKLVLKDIKHIDFWLTYYANTLSSVSKSEKPTIVKGTYKAINEQAQKERLGMTAKDAIKKVNIAINRIKKCFDYISVDEMIPYKYGSRLYSRDEYLDTIITHINMHIKYLKKQ